MSHKDKRHLPATQKASLAWGDPLPDWVEALARAVEQSSGARVASRIGVSDAMVSQGINNKYGKEGNGRIETLISAVRAHLMHEQIDCPALCQAIPKTECLEWRSWMGHPGGCNPTRIQMAQACKACVHFKEEDNDI